MAAEEPDQDLIFELEAGLKFIEEEFAKEEISLADFLPNGVITFQLLWMLFPPNILSIGQDEFRQQFSFHVQTCKEVEDQAGNVSLLLDCKNLDHNGRSLLERKSFGLKIESFIGARKISELPYFPLHFHPDPTGVMRGLLENGRKAMRFHGRHLVEYKGHALREGKDMLVKFNSHGRVMLDPETLESTEPSNRLVLGGMEAIKIKDLTDERIMTISPKLYGFSLGDKVWGKSASPYRGLR